MTHNTSHLFNLSVISYPKHDINDLTQEIEACAVHFCINMLEIGYPVMGKITGNCQKSFGQLISFSVKFRGSNLNSTTIDFEIVSLNIVIEYRVVVEFE